ncbi:MAG TPA: YwmB family TATA-box binding protein [Bacillales bacterium]|nr:YwmB family TATA-box binding protein [Bacillales bacterium]
MGKRISMIAFILLLFSGSYTKTGAQFTPVPLLDIVHVMEDGNIAVKHWSLYTKKIGRFIDTPKGYKRWVENLKHDLPRFQWTPIKKNNGEWLKITGVHTDKPTGVEERLTLLAYRSDGQWDTYTIYEAGSDSWDPTIWKRFSSTFYEKIHRYFPGNATIFTCVTGRLNAKMDFVLYDRAQKLLRSFAAEPVEQLKEKTFVSLSAYTEQWKQSIQTKNHPMNLQVALRSLGTGSAATVTIGTPIITTEY